MMIPGLAALNSQSQTVWPAGAGRFKLLLAQVVIGFQSGGYSIAHGRAQLPGRFRPGVAAGINPWDAGPHLDVGVDMPQGIHVQLVFQVIRVG